MVRRAIQHNTRRQTAADDSIERSWINYSITLPPEIVQAMGWSKGTMLEFTIAAKSGRPIVELSEAKEG